MGKLFTSMGRQLLREWLPPCVLGWARKRFGGIRTVGEWPALEAAGWPVAAEAASRGFSEGIRRMTGGQALSFLPEEEPLGWLREDPQFHHRIVQVGLVVASLPRTESVQRILDYGGGFGVHLHALKRLLPNLHLDYTVCELPNFCEAGRRLSPDLRFVSSLSEAAKGYDLVYASGSVQYTRNWEELVAGLAAASRGKVFVTRTPFVFKCPSFIVTQHAYSTEYPGWIFNYREFIQAFERHGFCLRETFVNGRGLAARNAPEQNVHLGLLFEPKIL
jgi:putative methyltransferase (TIGR04325 family)